MEFSVVSVPANPNALAAAIKSKAVNISGELQKELGIEDKMTVFEEKETEETNNEEVKIEVKEKPEDKPLIVVPTRVLRPHRAVRRVRVVINPKEVSSATMNMLRGKIY